MQLDGFVQLIELDGVENGCEGLVANDRALAWHRDEGRLDVVAWPVDPLSASQYLSTLLACRFERTLVSLNGILVDQWPEQGRRLERITGSDRAVCLGEHLFQPARDAAL